MATTWEPQVGDDAIELRHSHGSTSHDRIGEPVKVHRITDTIVVTSDGERYGRAWLAPLSEGPYSSRRLVQPHDDRVLCVKGREVLAVLARTTDNLAKVERTDPADVFAALSQVAATASRAVASYRALMREATEAKR
jgi:hypothetical protein